MLSITGTLQVTLGPRDHEDRNLGHGLAKRRDGKSHDGAGGFHLSLYPSFIFA